MTLNYYVFLITGVQTVCVHRQIYHLKQFRNRCHLIIFNDGCYVVHDLYLKLRRTFNKAKIKHSTHKQCRSVSNTARCTWKLSSYTKHCNCNINRRSLNIFIYYLMTALPAIFVMYIAIHVTELQNTVHNTNIYVYSPSIG